ncbi:MAG TPA: zinc ribbon domain-containing protein [Roseiflexaceae bacterium]|nr:zinc ribbon domain-containing protein [Roseiflexaceae bacterium]
MVERVCPNCQHGNPLDDQYCGKCGTALQRLLPAPRSETGLTIAGRQLPVTWQQLGRTVALGVVAVAAEAGLAWLRRRAAQPTTALTVMPRSDAPVGESLSGNPSSVITIISQRVVEVIESGSGTRQVSERSFWRKIEE